MRASGEKPFGKRDKSAAASDKSGSGWLAGLGALATSVIAYLIHRALVPKLRTTATTAGGDGGFNTSSEAATVAATEPASDQRLPSFARRNAAASALSPSAAAEL